MSKLIEFLSKIIPSIEFPININFDFSKNDFSKNTTFIKVTNNLKNHQENKINKKTIIKNKTINFLKAILISGVLIIPAIIILKSYLDLITYPFLEIFNLINDIPLILFFSCFIIYLIILLLIFNSINKSYFFKILVSIFGLYIFFYLSIKYLKGEF